MTESPEQEKPRPKPGPGRPDVESLSNGQLDDKCPMCYLFEDSERDASVGVIFSLMKALAVDDRELILQSQKLLTPIDAHVAAHVAYIFLHNACVLADAHPLDAIDKNFEIIRASISKG